MILRASLAARALSPARAVLLPSKKRLLLSGLVIKRVQHNNTQKRVAINMKYETYEICRAPCCERSRVPRTILTADLRP